LVDALVKLGAQAGRARTLREIATSPTLRIEEELQPALARAVDVLNAVRFGGATLEREEQHELDELLRELKAARSEPSEPEVAPAT
jgi:hypothetical protein